MEAVDALYVAEPQTPSNIAREGLSEYTIVLVLVVWKVGKNAVA